MYVTSVKVRSFPPVIFHTIPVALSIPISSRGDCMALSAASLARVLPTQRSTVLAGVGYINFFNSIICSGLHRELDRTEPMHVCI
jgi:hypothetical protein